MSGSGYPDCETSGIDFLWCAIVQGLVRTHGVVLGDILPDKLPQFSRSLVFTDVKALAFQAAEPTFDHDVVRPAGFAVHALTYAEIVKELLVIVAGELAALIRVDDGRRAVFVHGVLEQPARDACPMYRKAPSPRFSGCTSR